MIDYEAGDIILVRFSFTEKPGFKKRPALIINRIKSDKLKFGIQLTN